MKKVFPIIALIAALIIALSVAYYLVIFLPAKEKARQEQVNRELEIKQKATQGQINQESEIKQTEQQSQKNQQQIYKDCDVEARDKAKSLLQSKMEIAKNLNLTEIYELYKEFSDKGLFRKEDYNTGYEYCLRRNGIKY